MQFRILGAFFILASPMLLSSACAPGQQPTNGLGVSSPAPRGPRIPTPPDQTTVSTGGWESSGGGGVACFDTESEAQNAQSDIRTLGFLGTRSRSRVRSVVTLDTWDFVTDRRHSREPVRFISDYLGAKSFSLHRDLLRDSSPRTLLKKVTHNIRLEVPLFAERVKLVQEKFPLSTWIPSARIPMVNDSTPQISIPKKCLRIQLANRYTRSIPDKLPETQIFYDHQLFQLLTVLDQAMLLNHEHLYLIGKEAGHFHSDEIRKINAYLFSEDAFKRDQDVELSSRALRLRQIIGYPFGDYMRFFLSEHHGSARVLPGTAQSRYLALISLMKKMREAMRACLATSKANQQFCQKQTVESNSDLQKSLSPEESFLFIARFYLDLRAWDFNSELLTIPGYESLAARQCHEMVGRPVMHALEIQEKAKIYCREDLHLPIALLSELPLQRRFSCFSEKQTVSFHSQDKLIIAIEVNPETGAISSPLFQGRHGLASSIRGSLLRDFGMNNVEYKAQDTYRLWPATDSDQQLIQSLIEIEPAVLKSVTLMGGAAPHDTFVLSDPRAVLYAFGSIPQPKILSFEMNLECIVRETNLPESVWWY